MEYSQARLSYFRTLLNLSRLRFQFYSDLKPVLKDTMNIFREKEKEIIIQIIEKGIEDGLFHYENARSGCIALPRHVKRSEDVRS